MVMTELSPPLLLQYYEHELDSAVLDSKNNLAYFAGGWYAGSTFIAKIDIPTFSQVLPSMGDVVGEGWYWFSAVIDTENGYIYWGDGGNHIVKIKTPDFTVEDILTLDPEVLWQYSAEIDTIRGFAYFVSLGISQDDIRLTKISLSTFSAETVLLISVPPWGYTCVSIDTENNFLYVGVSMNTIGKILKVDLSTLAVVETLDLSADERWIASSVIDVLHGFVYFLTAAAGYTPKIVKIRLSDFQRVDTLPLDPADSPWLHASIINGNGGFAWFGLDNWPGIVVKVDLSDFSIAQRLTITGASGGLTSAVVDYQSKIMYFATEDWDYGRIVRIYDDDIVPPPPPAAALKRILGEGIFDSRLARRRL